MPLNSRLNGSKLFWVSDVSGGCPRGVLLNHQRYQTTKSAIATPTNHSAYFIFAVRIDDSPSYQTRDDLRKEDNQKNYCSSHPEQGNAKRAALPALIAYPVQLDEAESQQNGCTDEQPRSG